MATIDYTYWTQHTDTGQLPDPRISIARQMDWVAPTKQQRKDSTWTGCEPDNYNFAIFDQQPHDLKFIEQQCWYKLSQRFRGNKISGWFSVYVITEKELVHQFNQALIKIQPQAVWRYPKSQPMRPRRSLLIKENPRSDISDRTFTTEERLYQLGYYENLERKYFAGNEEKLIARIGQPRRAVLDYQPEDDSLSDSDYF